MSGDIYNNKDISGNSDDEMSFTLIVISQNLRAQWNANIAGNNISIDY